MDEGFQKKFDRGDSKITCALRMNIQNGAGNFVLRSPKSELISLTSQSSSHSHK